MRPEKINLGIVKFCAEEVERRRPCTVENCTNVLLARRMCGKHYARWRVHGDPHTVKTRAENLAGLRFGHLVAMSFSGRDDHKHRLWVCSCDCGGAITVPAGHLKSGHTRSCGCRSGVNVAEQGLSTVCNIYRRNAAERNVPWGLTRDQVRALVAGACSYCGSPPTPSPRSSTSFSLRPMPDLPLCICGHSSAVHSEGPCRQPPTYTSITGATVPTCECLSYCPNLRVAKPSYLRKLFDLLRHA